MGVSGVGKSTVGRRLASELSLAYIDGDDLHPQANIDKMSAGDPLTDSDRFPWLRRIGQWLADRPQGGAVSCSALLRSYRDIIRSYVPGAWFALLTADISVLRTRIQRPRHFMPESLLNSQLAALETLGTDERGSIYTDDTIENIVTNVASDVRSER